MDSNVDFGATTESSRAGSSGEPGAIVVRTGAVASVLRMMLVHAEGGLDLKSSCERAEAFFSAAAATLDDGQHKRWLAGAKTFARAIEQAPADMTVLEIAQSCRATLSLIQEAMLTIEISEIHHPERRAAVLRAILVEFPSGPDELRQ